VRALHKASARKEGPKAWPEVDVPWRKMRVWRCGAVGWSMWGGGPVLWGFG